jgi:transcriptional regulator with XRE-family HTH domain
MKAIGEEIKKARESLGWSRLAVVSRLPSGICDRTLLSYEHGTRQMTITRFLEVCKALQLDPANVITWGLQRAKINLENMNISIDVRKLANDKDVLYKIMQEWAINKLNSHAGFIAQLSPTAIKEFATLMNCTSRDLTEYLVKFTP